MKKVSVLFMCMLFVGFAAMAQRGGNGNRPDPKARAEAQAKVMKVDLNLNDAQYQKVLALNIAQAEKATAKRTEKKEEMEEQRAAMKAEREVFQQELKGILTPEQFKKHEAMMKERQENRGERGNKPGNRKPKN
ncbi:MAG: DUF4890 domain-containing protein [Spirosomaceae bacterium]|nr:DUF4890 domain-containing protein [Spirosomataceae bacterium]